MLQEAFEGQPPDIDAADGDAACLHIIKPGDQMADGCFPGAGGPDNGCCGALRHDKAHGHPDWQTARPAPAPADPGLLQSRMPASAFLRRREPKTLRSSKGASFSLSAALPIRLIISFWECPIFSQPNASSLVVSTLKNLAAGVLKDGAHQLRGII